MTIPTDWLNLWDIKIEWWVRIYDIKKILKVHSNIR